MRRALLFGALLLALAFFSFSTRSVGRVSAANNKERGVVTFTQTVQLLNVTLKGQYLFVHDDAAMARGEACTYVYKGLVAEPSKLVISFHCTPQARTKATSFVVRTSLLPTGLVDLREFQFAGSKEGHRVPVLIE